MASFLEELWNSVFTPGPTPTLVVATNAAFAALQFILLLLLIATYSIHFLILSLLCGGLWYSINWFVSELQAEKEKAHAKADHQLKKKSPDPESDTETESPPPKRSITSQRGDPSALLRPKSGAIGEDLRRRRSLVDSSGYVSTDSEWEKVSEGGDEK